MDCAKARDGKPFFLYLPYTSPHLPVIPLEQFRGKSGCGAYGDFMMETDWHIGRVMDALEAGGMTRNTLIVFSSDNGPENPWKKRIEQHQHYSSGPYRDGKRSIYEGGHRVPFIVRWPEVVKPGSVWDGPVCQTDLLATFADILGVKLPDNAGEDSVSFHGALTGEAGTTSDCQSFTTHRTGASPSARANGSSSWSTRRHSANSTTSMRSRRNGLTSSRSMPTSPRA